MEAEPGGQQEYCLTEKVLQQAACGRSYMIDVSKLDSKSVVELRRLIRDLVDRATVKYSVERQYVRGTKENISSRRD